MEDWHLGGWLVSNDGGHALRGVAEAGRGEGGLDSPGFVIFIALLVKFLDGFYGALENGILDEATDCRSSSNSFHRL
jgi:hypothetical protein